MISIAELKEIKKYLDSAENPLFLFDDDGDGLCSYLLLRKYVGKGEGVIVKGPAGVDESYLQKVKNYSPDRVFILDQPRVSQDFIDNVNVPIIWIDHHKPIKREGVKYFNPKIKNLNDDRPTTYWCYQVVKQNLWIAAIGVISDWVIPDFIKDFKRKYPGLIDKEKDPGDILYSTKLGEVCRIFSFLLRGKTSDVKKNIETILKIKTPYEILNKETENGRFLFNQSEPVKKRYLGLLKDALKVKPKGKLYIYLYHSGKLSMSADLSNELFHRFKDKVIVVAREKGDKMRLSLRSRKVSLPPILEKAFKEVEGFGGGHEHAVGALVAKKDFDKFIKILEENIESG